jgi:exodeoxyribonuclease VII large subunit
MLGHMAQRLDDLAERLETGLRVAAARRRDRFERLQDMLQHNNPAAAVSSFRSRIALLSLQSERLVTRHIEAVRQEFGDNAARLEVLSPLKTLARGYAIASRNGNGAVITDAATLTPGELLQLRFHRGEARCRVETSPFNT